MCTILCIKLFIHVDFVVSRLPYIYSNYVVHSAMHPCIENLFASVLQLQFFFFINGLLLVALRWLITWILNSELADTVRPRITGPCGVHVDRVGGGAGPSPGSDPQTRVSPGSRGTPLPRTTAPSSARPRGATAAPRCSGPTAAALRMTEREPVLLQWTSDGSWGEGETGTEGRYIL